MGPPVDLKLILQNGKEKLKENEQIKTISKRRETATKNKKMNPRGMKR